MLSQSVLCLCGAAAVIGGARFAHADAAHDFKNGTSLYIKYASAHFDDEFSNEAAVLASKPAGTLDFALPASAIGVQLPITLNLHGTILSSNRVQFTFNDSFGSGVDITGAGDMLTSADGTVVVQTTLMPGADGPQCDHTSCIGDVYLDLESGTVNAHGTFGNKVITIDEAFGIGGVPRAKIKGVFPPPPAEDAHGAYDLPFCTSSVKQHAPFLVELETPAPTGGTRVDFSWPAGGGVAFPNTVIVPGGKDAVTVDMTVGANFVGTVHVTAAAGGAGASTDFTVAPASACQPPGSHPQYEAYVPPLLVGCTACSQFIEIDNEVDQVTSVNGQLEYISHGVLTPFAKVFTQATSIGVAAIDSFGFVVGRMTVGGVAQAYRANLKHGAHAPELIGQMVPQDVNAWGTLVGYRVDAATGLSHSVYNTGRGVIDLTIASSFGVRQSAAHHISESGQVAGTFTDSNGVVRGYRWVNGATTTLPVIASKPAIPAAINAANQIAVNAGGAGIIAANGAITQLGVPAGYGSFEVTSLNRWGIAVGVATSLGATVVKTAFAWRPGSGFVSLTNYAPGLVTDNALRITDANQVVVHGTAGGITDLYLLTL